MMVLLGLQLVESAVNVQSLLLPEGTRCLAISVASRIDRVEFVDVDEVIGHVAGVVIYTAFRHASARGSKSLLV